VINENDAATISSSGEGTAQHREVGHANQCRADQEDRRKQERCEGGEEAGEQRNDALWTVGLPSEDGHTVQFAAANWQTSRGRWWVGDGASA
jgi:hypothetical protein